MSEIPPRRQFSAEFKRDAVDLTQQPGRTSTDVAHPINNPLPTRPTSFFDYVVV